MKLFCSISFYTGYESLTSQRKLPSGAGYKSDICADLIAIMLVVEVIYLRNVTVNFYCCSELDIKFIAVCFQIRLHILIHDIATNRIPLSPPHTALIEEVPTFLYPSFQCPYIFPGHHLLFTQTSGSFQWTLLNYSTTSTKLQCYKRYNS